MNECELVDSRPVHVRRLARTASSEVHARESLNFDDDWNISPLINVFC